MEWVKFFGALTGKEAEAEEAFAEQTEILEEVESGEKTGKTIAFFYVTSNGLIQVRQSTDYIPKLIELAGGRYIFDDLEDSGSGRSTLNMQVEDFYAGAKDADILDLQQLDRRWRDNGGRADRQMQYSKRLQGGTGGAGLLHHQRYVPAVHGDRVFIAGYAYGVDGR